MSTPYDLLAGPWTLWTATKNSTDPVDLDAAPSGGTWTKLGTAGSDNYNEDGITITPEEAIESFRPLGKTGKVKSWRTEEDITVTVKVHDMTAATLRKAFNNNSLTTVSAGADQTGAQKFDLYKGHAVTQYALLMRSDSGSPYSDSLIAQIWLPVVEIRSVGEISIVKGEPMGYELEFGVLHDRTNAFGNVRLADVVSTS